MQPDPLMIPVPYRPRRFKRWSLILLIPHMLVGWLFLFSYIGMMIKVVSWDDYAPATFVVTSHEETTMRRGHHVTYLRGSIGEHDESYTPPGLVSLQDLRQHYPIGTRTEVLYDPDASRTFLQGQTLRVISPEGLQGALKFVVIYTCIFVIPWSAFAVLLYRRSALLFSFPANGSARSDQQGKAST